MNPTTPGTAPQYGPQPPAPPPVTVVPVPAPHDVPADSAPRELILVSHSPLVYWWPVWVVGYVFAALTWWAGQPHQIGSEVLRFHPDSSTGVLFFLTLFLVIVISNVSVRGYASLTVVMAAVLVSVLMAYFGAWGPVLGWLGDLNVYLNQGAYFWFATLLFVVWAVTVFVVDRFNYWRIAPGQITYVTAFGTGAKSYDTENMVLEKRRDDLFRHWLLGLGSGDLRIHTYGGRSQEIFVPNVLFIGSKIGAIQQMIAIEPGKFGHAAIE
ncbi:hypothetical protein GobsT_49920 [Gemmata obscuriglobus]|uniref:Uncharacterized protein n=1 Tax=Gemmata obscuriglobus TaxID=114 RepID=A0A2Z3GRU0_9BACT|nr:hypothetical protein [Gemmata obscuriglobus]AWM37089.1 hypothetical protein C1280_08665 [Gemmata obscuriglobus]QEG30189.1 hypothetical protein GobsT_49920 [Gemmata obscuriglobus]VTS09513.1 Uncharacterized protein OS=Rhodomicrobium vannielii (strain ATCC 17100 / ATH 3.1.1 / DSM 162 / LMG 4299) GN=Rvan_2716 PE=4 SV=1 [Gemmata obscuriglobus UQM 2246]